MPPKITDAELDEIEEEIGQIEYLFPEHRTTLRLIKALRAYRQDSTAKDAVVEAIRDCADRDHPANRKALRTDAPPGIYAKIPASLWNKVLDSLDALAVLDKETDDDDK